MSLQPLKITAIAKTDSGGSNVIPNAAVSIVDGAGGYPQLWLDQSGTTPESNPFTCDSNGEALVYIEGGYYSVAVGGGQSWDVDLSSAVEEKDNYAAVRALSGYVAFSQVSVAGHTTPGDGGGGTFYRDSGDVVSPDNGGTILVDSMGRRWKRPCSGGIHVSWFGAAQDGVTDDTAANQAAIDFALNNGDYDQVIFLSGPNLITSSLIVDRLVDNQVSEFRFISAGGGGGFYTSGNVTIFDSSIAVTTDPMSEFLTFEGVYFRTSSIFNSSYVLSEKFLRCKFLNCDFRLIRCILSSIYVQTLYFIACNIRNNPASFVNCVGLYDVVFDDCVIENGSTLVRSVDLSRGTNGLRIVNSVIEGIQSSVVIATGLAGFKYSGNHIEANFSPEINTFAGVLMNKTVEISGNYIYNNAGATVYHGPTEKVISFANHASPSLLHSNAAQVVDLVSLADECAGGISDAPKYSTINGVYRAGGDNADWVSVDNHITKNKAGEFGFGSTPVSTVRAYVKGASQTSADFSAVFADSNGNTIAGFRNDRGVTLPALPSYADDTAAAAGGLPIGYLYRTASAVKVRVS